MQMHAPPSVSELFAALGDETRLRIVNLLLAERELCVCDLQAVLASPQPTVSRHLAYLRRTGLVAARRVDQWMYYSIPATSPVRGPMKAFLKKALEVDSRLAQDIALLRAMLRKGQCAVSTSMPVQVTMPRGVRSRT